MSAAEPKNKKRKGNKPKKENDNVNETQSAYNTQEFDIISKGSTLSGGNRDKLYILNELNSSSEVVGIVNKYEGTLEYTVATLSGPAGTLPADHADAQQKVVYDQVASPSLFNPYYAVSAAGVTANVPLLDTTKKGDKISAKSTSQKDKIVNRKIYLYETNDCSIENLVKLSKIPDGPLGQARYKYSDFMYCKNVGKVSNNHLITLRKFDAPIGDNIFYGTSINDDSNLSIKGDVGRLITWFGTDDNKLEDILKFTFFAEWKNFDAKIQEIKSQEHDDARGIVGGLVNMFSPKSNEATARGIAPNALSMVLGSSGSDAFLTTAPYADNPAVNGAMYDKNRVYEPKDTIRSTHKYEGTLHFEHEFTLKFTYKLRGYDNINAKTAFLDLLGNILAVTYRQGTFWGGEQRIIGAPPNKQGWKKAQEFVENGLDAGGTFISTLLGGGSISDATSKFASTIGSCFNSLFGINLGEAFANPKEALSELVGEFKKAGGGNALKGSVMNSLGRPAVYAFDSLLTNDAVGLWHVTIGNPLNPIASMGNLILTNCELSHSGPLGLDDFPTEITVSVTLKHGTPRDSVDIQKMYTQGRNAIYSKIGNSKNFTFGQNSVFTAEGKDAKKKAAEDYAAEINNAILNSGKADAETGVLDMFTVIEISNKQENKSHDVAGWMGDYDLVRLRSNMESLK